jgi:hypothetical protein
VALSVLAEGFAFEICCEIQKRTELAKEDATEHAVKGDCAQLFAFSPVHFAP